VSRPLARRRTLRELRPRRARPRWDPPEISL